MGRLSCSWCYQLSADPGLGRLLAEVALAAAEGVLLVQTSGQNVLLHLEETTDVDLDEDR